MRYNFCTWCHIWHLSTSFHPSPSYAVHARCKSLVFVCLYERFWFLRTCVLSENCQPLKISSRSIFWTTLRSESSHHTRIFNHYRCECTFWNFHLYRDKNKQFAEQRTSCCLVSLAPLAKYAELLLLVVGRFGVRRQLVVQCVIAVYWALQKRNQWHSFQVFTIQPGKEILVFTSYLNQNEDKA